MPEQSSQSTEVSVVENKALLALCSQDGVKRRFEQLLGGRKGAAFISSIISCANANSALSKCRAESIVAAGVMAATVDLPVTPGLGWAAIVPFKGEAVLQIMKDGYVQLALRTGQYRSINCSDVYEDEFESWNPHTGTLKTTDQKTWRQREEHRLDKIVGYLAFFELINGFKKYSYWTIDQLEAHGKKYSQSYQYKKGLWVTDKPAMYLKTPIKLLIRHFGPMSTQMQYAVEFDQAARKADGTVVYPDGPVDTTAAAPDAAALVPAPKRLEKGTPKEKPKPEPAKPKESPSEGPGKDHRAKPTEPETKPKAGKEWEGPMPAITEHECGRCADPIEVNSQMYRKDTEEEVEYAHAEHFQARK